MSRLGKKPISMPSGVETKIDQDFIIIKGKKGELKQQIHPLVKISLIDNSVVVDVDNKNDKLQKSLWGTFARLIMNMITGVTVGFEKKLELVGVGYRATLNGNKITLTVGFSHLVEFILPAGVIAAVDKNILTITGIDKQLVGEVAAKIRRIKKPEPYKGTGIKYADEVIHIKPGKRAAATTS